MNIQVRQKDCFSGVYTNHKLFLEKDRTMVKKLLRGKEHRKPPEVLSSWMRKFFRELTESFSIPLVSMTTPTSSFDFRKH